MTDPVFSQSAPRSYTFLIFQNLNANFGAFMFGYMLGVYNPLMDCINYLYSWNSSTGGVIGMNGWVTFVLPMGATFGAWIMGIIVRKVSRKNAMIAADAIGIIGIGITLIKSVPALMIGRFIAGISVGINCVMVPIYVNETSPQKVAGIMGAIFNTGFFMAVTVTDLLGLAIPYNDKLQKNPDITMWRVIFFIPMFTQAIRTLLLLFVFRYDTPYGIIASQKENCMEEARKSLEQIYKPEFVDKELEICKLRNERSSNMTYKEAFQRKFLRQTIVAIVLQFFQQWSGVQAVIYYSQNIFSTDTNDLSHHTALMSKIFTIIVGVCFTLSTVICGYVIDLAGRKKILIFGNFLCIVCLVLLGGLGFGGITSAMKYFVAAYSFCFGIALGPIVWLIIPEFAPDKSVSCSTISNLFWDAIVGLTFPLLKSKIRLEGTFLLYGGLSVLNYFFIQFFVVETKGRTYSQIEKEYQQGKKAKQLLDSDESQKQLI